VVRLARHQAVTLPAGLLLRPARCSQRGGDHGGLRLCIPEAEAGTSA
jgi:hypothetical protein